MAENQTAYRKYAVSLCTPGVPMALLTVWYDDSKGQFHSQLNPVVAIQTILQRVYVKRMREDNEGFPILETPPALESEMDDEGWCFSHEDETQSALILDDDGMIMRHDDEILECHNSMSSLVVGEFEKPPALMDENVRVKGAELRTHLQNHFERLRKKKEKEALKTNEPIQKHP